MALQVCNLLENVHIPLLTDAENELAVKIPYSYYHYNCDGFTDAVNIKNLLFLLWLTVCQSTCLPYINFEHQLALIISVSQGWGCGYRTCQSICSSIIHAKKLDQTVPSIRKIQSTLVEIGDKNKSFVGSREWIGTLEATYVIDTLFDVPCRLVHIGRNESIAQHKDAIVQYFKDFGCLMMMGGDMDASSKGVAGIRTSDQNGVDLLVVDPHFVGRAQSADQLIGQGFVKWQNQANFFDSSFYNLCLPKIK